MAASSRRTTFLALMLIITIWVWALGGALFVLRWSAIVRPLAPAKALFPYGEMRVGVDASYPPFAVATSDRFFGLDIDLARALADELDIPVRFVNLGYDGLYDALRTDQADVLISALIINPVRRDDVIYSQPYFDAGLVLVNDEDSSIRSMRDMPGRTLAVEFGSLGQTEADRWLRRVLPFDVLPYELPEYALDSVRLGNADAALVDNIAARLYLREHFDWKAQLTLVTSVPFAIATRIDRGDRASVLGAALQKITDDGTLAAIIRRYL
jgi:glutamine transport system substrate-binding protein